MDPKYKIPIKVVELDELLVDNGEERIWEHKVISNAAIINIVIQFVTIVACVYFVFGILNVLLSLILIIPYLIFFYSYNSMRYRIYSTKISFEWGLFEKTVVSIPFTDISAINLVKYNHSKYSTIYFGTNSVYKIKKIDFDQGKTRLHHTYENVKDGDKVNELLLVLWNRNNVSNKLLNKTII